MLGGIFVWDFLCEITGSQAADLIEIEVGVQCGEVVKPGEAHQQADRDFRIESRRSAGRFHSFGVAHTSSPQQLM